jgi:N-methylhydantoinase A/oxoprolinase/acetone carboxylase beta subunit
MITGAVVSGSVEVEKPKLPNEALVGPDDRGDARKGRRSIYWDGSWLDAEILDLEKLRAGNVVRGPAVVESPASTMLVPPGRSARLDEYRIFHMNIHTRSAG